jgi:CMP/dCMP kinase
MKIAIDGPSASGKGTISKILAKNLNMFYLNTGKIYRIVAMLALKKGGDLKTSSLEIAKNIEVHYKNEEDNKNIYTQEIAKITSEIAKIPELRSALLNFQKNFAQNTDNIIIEGRDIGTVIMPNADFKFYLDASPEVRAKRRELQLKNDRKEANFTSILNEIKERDKNDMEREVSSLKKAEDAHFIDTGTRTIDEVVNEIMVKISK